MSDLRQTSVRVLPVVLQSLDALASSWSLSRDATVRLALRRHLEAQKLIDDPGSRFSHITTVLRYPPKSPGKHGTDGRVHLRVRVEPDLLELADATQLLLPGQTSKRAHRDYVSRPLTDAITTAVFWQDRFVIDEFVDLPQVMRHRMAFSLWRLVFSATFTPSETQAMGRRPGSDGERSPEELAAVLDLRAGEFAWHHPSRTALAVHFARELLTGPYATRHSRMLLDQDALYEETLDKLERGMHWLLGEAPETWAGSTAGRGGSSLWRRARAAALVGVVNWYFDPDRPAEFTVETPNWRLRTPPGWQPVVTNQPLTPAQQADVAAGRVLALHRGNTAVLIGYLSDGTPVPGLDTVLNTWTRLGPATVAELLGLVDYDLDGIYLLAPEAHRLGFISADERDNLISGAALATDQRIRARLADCKHLYDSEEYDELVRLQHDPEAFERAAKLPGLSFHIKRPWWRWDVRHFHSTLDVEANAPARVAALAEAFSNFHRYRLERSMEWAGKRALAGYTRPLVHEYYDEDESPLWTVEDLVGADEFDDV